MRYTLKIVLLVFLFLIGGIIAAIFLPIFRAVPLRCVNSLIPLIQMLWLRTACWVLGVNITVKGTAMSVNGLWLSNHISWLDIVVLGSLRPVAFLSKSEVASWFLIGFLGKQSGNLFIQRGSGGGSALEIMTKRLQQGDNLLLFPEGTTTRGDTVRHFHGRLLQPAISAGVAMQAVAIDYQGIAKERVPFVDDDEFMPHLLGLLHLPTIDVTVHLAEPLLLEEAVPRNTLARLAREQVCAALGFSV
jgi:1-acyl-sn-glycerol-3-phosphate acyltransferase